jgi:hypothetical protein
MLEAGDGLVSELHFVFQLRDVILEIFYFCSQVCVLHADTRCMVFAAIASDLEVCVVGKDQLREREMEDVLDALLMPRALERRDICIRRDRAL